MHVVHMLNKLPACRTYAVQITCMQYLHTLLHSCCIITIFIEHYFYKTVFLLSVSSCSRLGLAQLQQ